MGTEETFPERVKAELVRARAKHPIPLRSAHETESVVGEEYREFRSEVYRQSRDTDQMLKELVETAAMCQRGAEDLGLCPKEQRQ